MTMINQENTAIIIPARLASTRLPNKPLLPINGKPMILHVWEQAMVAELGTVIVATDSTEIKEVISAAGGICELTNSNHQSGTDRIYEALANFDKDANVLTRFFGYDPSRYDITALKESFNDFSIVVNRYPDTKYAEDSLNRLIYIRNQIARSELYIAEYYHKRSAHVAAIERIKYMLENYGGTPSTEQGLLILIESYNSLNMRQLAFDTARVLIKNYPEYTIDEVNQSIVVSRVRRNDDKVGSDNSHVEDNWYDIFNIFN